jgi:uncharacterized protein (TIGR00661 family)
MGYGRGHAMRSRAVIPALMAEHEITVFAGGDAHDVLAAEFPTVRIPTIGYAYDDQGAHSTWRTLTRNIGPFLELRRGGPSVNEVERELRERRIDLLISDSEPWTCAAADRLSIPRISFDHVGIIAWCKPHFPASLRLVGLRDAIVYRALYGRPDRILIASFYPAEPRRSGTRIVGPILRGEIHGIEASRGEHLLAYFNKGEHQFRPQIRATLKSIGCPVIVYGTPFRGHDGVLEFRAPSVDGFIDDLARCRGVIATAGNQLIGEAIHFGKPFLALPEDAFEQQLNAWMIERMGIGMRGDRRRLTGGDVARFLATESRYRARLAAVREKVGSDAIGEATAALQRFIEELPAPQKVARAPGLRGIRSATPF